MRGGGARERARGRVRGGARERGGLGMERGPH